MGSRRTNDESPHPLTNNDESKESHPMYHSTINPTTEVNVNDWSDAQLSRLLAAVMAVDLRKIRRRRRAMLAAAALGLALTVAYAAPAAAHCATGEIISADGDGINCPVITVASTTSSTAAATTTTTVAVTSSTVRLTPVADTTPDTTTVPVIDESHPVAPGVTAVPTSTTLPTPRYPLTEPSMPTELPATGADSEGLIAAGFFCIFIGVTFVQVNRRNSNA